jgi:hypothetical protein
MPRRVKASVHPGEGLATVLVTWRRIYAPWQAAIQVPGEKQPAAFGVDVRESSPGFFHMEIVLASAKILVATL